MSHDLPVVGCDRGRELEMQKLTTGVDFFTEYRARALSDLPLVGRSRELSELQATVRSRSPALIEAAPDLGKTGSCSN